MAATEKPAAGLQVLSGIVEHFQLPDGSPEEKLQAHLLVVHEIVSKHIERWSRHYEQHVYNQRLLRVMSAINYFRVVVNTLQDKPQFASHLINRTLATYLSDVRYLWSFIFTLPS